MNSYVMAKSLLFPHACEGSIGTTHEVLTAWRGGTLKKETAQVEGPRDVSPSIRALELGETTGWGAREKLGLVWTLFTVRST